MVEVEPKWHKML